MEIIPHPWKQFRKRDEEKLSKWTNYRLGKETKETQWQDKNNQRGIKWLK